MRFEIFGRSDDQIYVKARQNGETGCEARQFDYHEGGTYLEFPSGTVLRIRYTDNAVWVFDWVAQLAYNDSIEITPNLGPDSDQYSDRAYLESPAEGGVLNVNGWKSWPPADAEYKNKVEDWNKLKPSQYRKLYEAIKGDN